METCFNDCQTNDISMDAYDSLENYLNPITFFNQLPLLEELYGRALHHRSSAGSQNHRQVSLQFFNRYFTQNTIESTTSLDQPQQNSNQQYPPQPTDQQQQQITTLNPTSIGEKFLQRINNESALTKQLSTRLGSLITQSEIVSTQEFHSIHSTTTMLDDAPTVTKPLEAPVKPTIEQSLFTNNEILQSSDTIPPQTNMNTPTNSNTTTQSFQKHRHYKTSSSKLQFNSIETQIQQIQSQNSLQQQLPIEETPRKHIFQNMNQLYYGNTQPIRSSSNIFNSDIPAATPIQGKANTNKLRASTSRQFFDSSNLATADSLDQFDELLSQQQQQQQLQTNIYKSMPASLSVKRVRTAKGRSSFLSPSAQAGIGSSISTSQLLQVSDVLQKTTQALKPSEPPFSMKQSQQYKKAQSTQINRTISTNPKVNALKQFVSTLEENVRPTSSLKQRHTSTRELFLRSSQSIRQFQPTNSLQLQTQFNSWVTSSTQAKELGKSILFPSSIQGIQGESAFGVTNKNEKYLQYSEGTYQI